jgi:uncharacterized membrane protein
MIFIGENPRAGARVSRSSNILATARAINSPHSRLRSARQEDFEYNDPLAMDRSMLRKIPLAPRVLLSFLWGGLCTALVSAPWLASHGYTRGAALMYALFSPVCHQDAARSFAFFGHPCAVCHRCAGIYVALFLTSLVPFELGFLIHSLRRRRFWILAATAPLVLDFLAPFTGIWTNTAGSRFVTGLLFGIMLSSLLVPAIAEFMDEVRSRFSGARSDALGGLL